MNLVLAPQAIPLTIVCPIFNIGRRFTTFWEHVAAILTTELRLEVVIIDDGSRDDTYLQLNAAYRQLPPQTQARICLLTQKNAGLSCARNKGLAHARGEYILFLDDDDELILGNLAALINEALESGADMLALPYIERADSETPMAPHQGLGEFTDGPLYLCLSLNVQSHFITPSWAYCYKSSFLKKKKLRFHPGLIHEDCLFTPQALLAADKLKLFNKPAYIYIKRANSITTTRNEAKDRKRIRDLAFIINRLAKKSKKQSSNVRAALARWQAFLLNYQLDILQTTKSRSSRFVAAKTALFFALNNRREFEPTATHQLWYRALVLDAIKGQESRKNL